jgi:hypothetical protein
MSTTSAPPGPATLRAELARLQVKLYHLAPEVGIHPVRLGQMLRERVPMPPAVVERLLQALRRRAEER